MQPNALPVATGAVVRSSPLHPLRVRSIVQLYLALLARLTIWKHRPRIVAVTGSVGKSGTREAIAAALSAKYSVRSASGNLNNEFGVPLAILGFGMPRGIIGWLLVLLIAPLRAIFSWSAPSVFVLEYGIDHPGDMDVLLAIARPHVSVVTCVESVHLENFRSWNDLATEKGKLVHGTLPDGVAILNYDTFATKHMAEISPVPHLTFGLNARAQFSASSVETSRDGTTFTVRTPRREKLAVRTPLLGKHVAYTFLPAIAVAEVFGIDGADAIRKLERVQPLPGRLTLLPGTRGTTILDSTYNAEPASMHAAIDLLRSIPAPRTIAILGDMLELGERERDAHVALGRTVSAVADLALLFGPRMEFAYNAIRNQRTGRMSAFHFTDRAALIAFVLPKLRSGDLILVKGSQGMRLEAVVAALVDAKAVAPEQLVRQSREWKRKRDTFGRAVA